MRIKIFIGVLGFVVVVAFAFLVFKNVSLSLRLPDQAELIQDRNGVRLYLVDDSVPTESDADEPPRIFVTNDDKILTRIGIGFWQTAAIVSLTEEDIFVGIFDVGIYEDEMVDFLTSPMSLYLISKRDGAVRSVIYDGDQLGISSDGQRMVYQQSSAPIMSATGPGRIGDTDLYFINLQLGSLSHVVGLPRTNPATYNVIEDFSFSPDGVFVVVVAEERDIPEQMFDETASASLTPSVRGNAFLINASTGQILSTKSFTIENSPGLAFPLSQTIRWQDDGQSVKFVFVDGQEFTLDVQ